jgi:hypothetical protein
MASLRGGGGSLPMKTKIVKYQNISLFDSGMKIKFDPRKKGPKD